jgi:hypothetical protein
MNLLNYKHLKYALHFSILKRRVKIACLAALFSLSFIVDDACINSIRRVFDEMNKSASANKVTYLKYNVITTLSVKDKNDKYIVNDSEFEVISSNNRARIYGKEMIVYRDEKNTFSILPQKKIIYWTNSYINKNNNDVYKNLKIMQDSVFLNNERVDCKDIKGQPYNKEITIFLGKKVKTSMKINSVTYCLNTSKKSLSNVSMVYMPNQPYQKNVYVFKEQNFDYKKENLNTPSIDLVFENKNKLKKQFEGYKIIDNRK